MGRRLLSRRFLHLVFDEPSGKERHGNHPARRPPAAGAHIAVGVEGVVIAAARDGGDRRQVLAFHGPFLRLGRRGLFLGPLQLRMAQTVGNQLTQSAREFHIGGDVFQRVVFRSGDAHRAVEVGEAGFQIVPAAHQQRLRIDEFHPDQIQIEFGFQLLPIERLDLARDDAALSHGFFRDVHQPQPFQTVQVAALDGYDDEGAPGADILFLRPLAVLGRLHQIFGVAEIVDPLARQDAGGVGAQVGLEQAAADQEAGIDAPGSCRSIGIGKHLRIVERLGLIGPGAGSGEAGVGLLHDRMALQAGFNRLLQAEKTALVGCAVGPGRLGQCQRGDCQHHGEEECSRSSGRHGLAPSYVAGDDGWPAERRSNFCCDSFASGNLNGEACTGLPSRSRRFPTTTTSSAPPSPLVISIHVPFVMPVCTGTDLALPWAMIKTDLPFAPLITACGGNTSASGISRRSKASSA